jgi:hypothetical protein
MLFQKGQSGNPAGRPRGSRNRATALFRDLLEDNAEAIVRKAISLAKTGDMSAVRVCMDRLAPARRKAPVACRRSKRRPIRWRRSPGLWPRLPTAS